MPKRLSINSAKPLIPITEKHFTANAQKAEHKFS